MASTYLRGLQREVIDGFVHPFFNLHTVRTYRSSSDSPNFQNIPVRDPEAGRLIRRAFVPRKGRVLVDVDYVGIEIRVAACYHTHPAMIRYIEDPALDLHRDMAAKCYKLPVAKVDKAIRYYGKNQFVFPQFYGDFYIDCARGLWEAAAKLKFGGGTLMDHLRSIGFRRLGALDPQRDPLPGSFEEHIQRVEKHFWQEMFPVYFRWKQAWVDRYRRTGYIDMLTGFRCWGPMKRNEAINYAIQGSAFHCLLWALIRIVLRELRRHKMRSLIVGQIHDSLVGDVPEDELEDFCSLVRDVMVDKLRAAWEWIIVPLEVEIACSDESWANMKVLVA